MKLYQQERDMAEMQRWALVTTLDAVGIAWNHCTGLGREVGEGEGDGGGDGRLRRYRSLPLSLPSL